jgi:Sulfotransferase family
MKSTLSQTTIPTRYSIQLSSVLSVSLSRAVMIQLFMGLTLLFLIINCIQMRTLHYFEDVMMISSVSFSSSNTAPSFYTSHDVTRQTATTTTSINERKGSEAKVEEAGHVVVVQNDKTNNNRVGKSKVRKDLVQRGDYIYYYNVESSWDAAPIVIPQYKLIFFTIPKVGCTIWKQLFRRMMNYSDWTSQDYEQYQPHNPNENGLLYLYNYSIEEASSMMTSPDWTRAMMVREPKQRFLSAFLDKAVGNFHTHIRNRCCPTDETCIENAQTISGFVHLCTICDDDHWRAQHTRIDYKFWPYIDHISHVETAAKDAESLLRHIGAWEVHGESGWGEHGTHPIFAYKGSNSAGMNHSTYAEHQVWKWYTPETEQLVERFYQADYDNPLFQFQQNNCLTCID